jgi:divalent metal cation (Fe/Co/Zn/Cd) transporter
LLLIWIFNLHILDPIAAILIALIITKESYEMLTRSFSPLMDAQLSDDELGKVNSIIAEHQGIFIDYHELRTRRSGKIKHIDLHMTIPYKMTIKEFHDISDHIEEDIEQELKNTKVLVHGEPCNAECNICTSIVNCKYKK